MRHTFIAYCLSLLLSSILTQTVLADSSNALPRLPDQSTVLFANQSHTVTDGKAWLTQTTMGHHNYHMHGPSTLQFNLSEMKLEPGTYRLGLITRTGTTWRDSRNQIKQYRIKLITADKQAIELGTPSLLNEKQNPPIRESGKENAYANWFGTVVLPNASELNGKEILEVTNLAGHGGVIAIWADTNLTNTASATLLKMQTPAKHNAFILGQTPTVEVSLTQPAASGDQDALLKLQRYDMITKTTDQTVLPVKLLAGQTIHIKHPYPTTPGLYRVTAALVDSADSPITADTVAVEQLYACTPTKWAKDLPDDWPLAAHVDRRVVALPGFKHFRYFAHWSRIHTAPGVYHWEHFDEKYRFHAISKIFSSLRYFHRNSIPEIFARILKIHRRNVK